MKIYKIIIIVGLLAISFLSCKKDFLDRTPLSQVDPDNYFKTGADLSTYCNSFYNYLPGTAIFNKDAVSDDVECSNSLLVQGIRTVPTDATSAGWTRSEERRVGEECRSRWSPYH